MNRSLSWIDESSWSDLLERSGLAAANRPPVATSRQRPRRRPSRAPTVPIVLKPPARPAAERPPLAHAEPPELHGRLDDRLRQLVSWLSEMTHSHLLFIADESGLPLTSVGDASDLVATCTSMMDGLDTFRQVIGTRQPSCCSLVMEHGQVFNIAETENEWGRFALGFVSEGFSNLELLQRIPRELRRAFQEKGEMDV